MILKICALFFLLIISTAGKSQDRMDVAEEVVDNYMSYSRVLVQNTVGYSAPVSARSYAYISIAAHEAAASFSPEITALHERLSRFSYALPPVESDNCALPIVLNQVYYNMMSYLFRGAPNYYLDKLKLIYDKHDRQLTKSYSKRVRKRSKVYADHLTSALIEWSKLDQGDEAFLNNYSPDFEIESCDSCWVQTTPGYLPALLPYWKKNKPFISGVRDVTNGYATMTFDEDSSSLLFREAYDVYLNSEDNNLEFQTIAEYWDDGTGISGTPSGHLFSIAQQLSAQKGLPLFDKLKLFATLGIVLNDVVIVCWELKYQHNFIRPITYIQRLIYPQFNTRIDTPSFPESPSGHSFHSGAAGAVFKSFFGNTIQFTDSTNMNRPDIIGDPRYFNSINQLVEEISISRFYGGIHFRKTLSESLLYGEKLGVFILEKLETQE